MQFQIAGSGCSSSQHAKGGTHFIATNQAVNTGAIRHGRRNKMPTHWQTRAAKRAPPPVRSKELLQKMTPSSTNLAM